MTDNNFLNDSELPTVMEFAAATDSGPFQFVDQFAEFDYAEPPLAEIQILRVLDSHIKRKRKDQLDKARRFKEQLLLKKQESATRNREKEGVMAAGIAH